MCSPPRLASTDSVIHNASTTLLLSLSCNKSSQTANYTICIRPDRGTLDLHMFDWFHKSVLSRPRYYLLPSYGNSSPSLPTRPRSNHCIARLRHHAFMHLHQGPSCASCMSHCCTDMRVCVNFPFHSDVRSSSCEAFSTNC